MAGRTLAQLARAACEGTVRNTLSVVLDKLGLRDRTQLAIRYGKRPFQGSAH